MKQASYLIAIATLALSLAALPIRAEEPAPSQVPLVAQFKELNGRALDANFMEIVLRNGQSPDDLSSTSISDHHADVAVDSKSVTFSDQAKGVAVKIEILDATHAKISKTYDKKTFKNWTALATIAEASGRYTVYTNLKNRQYDDPSVDAVRNREKDEDSEEFFLKGVLTAFFGNAPYDQVVKAVKDEKGHVVMAYTFAKDEDAKEKNNFIIYYQLAVVDDSGEHNVVRTYYIYSTEKKTAQLLNP